jgi:hypothetical protein
VTWLTLLGWNTLVPTSRSPRRHVSALMCALTLAAIDFVITALRPKPPTG